MSYNSRNIILGRNMAALRESRGLTIQQVCIDHFLQLRRLSAWEEGRGGFPYGVLAKLCAYYGYTDIYKLITVEMRFTFNPLQHVRRTQEGTSQEMEEDTPATGIKQRPRAVPYSPRKKPDTQALA